MKKSLIIAAMAIAVYACSHKTIAPTTETKIKTETGTTETKTKVETTTSATTSTDATAEMVAKGQVVYTNRCGRCHNLKPVGDYTAQRWEGILKSMIPKAKLTEEEGNQVTAYVMANAKK